MSQEVPWPRPGDRLFADDGGGWNACVGWSDNQWYGYIEGFRLGARILAERVAETEREQDYLVYPIVFGYRQALEVALKHLLSKGSQFIDGKVKVTGHSLLRLWAQCRPMLEKVWPDGGSEELDAVEGVLKQFEAKDPGSTVFRYPLTLEGAPSLPNAEQINIVNFAEVAERAFALIDSCRSEFCRILDDLQEMERAYSS
jgi:hypothetical protein